MYACTIDGIFKQRVIVIGYKINKYENYIHILQESWRMDYIYIYIYRINNDK